MAKAKVFDKNKPHGEILGGGARYEQDGVLFDAEFKEFKEAVVDLLQAGGEADPLLQQALEEIKRLQAQLAEAHDALLLAETERDSLLSDVKPLDDNSGFVDAPVKTDLDAQLEAQQGPL